MANQPKKYKKFVATAATATLVASAIVPVASADTIKFSDVQDSSEFAPYIYDLAEKKVMTGTAGKFNPQADVSRAAAVKILGKWLVNVHGQEIPEDYKTEQRFKDLPVNYKDQELLQYAALVYDLGVFTGAAGNLNPTGILNREQMAKVIVVAYSVIQEVDIVDLVADFESELTDLDKVSASNVDYVKVLEKYGITTTKTFNPKGKIKRQHLAKFLSIAINDETLAEDAKELADGGGKPTPPDFGALEKEITNAVIALVGTEVTAENAKEVQAKLDAVNAKIAQAEALVAASEGLTAEEKAAFQAKLDTAKKMLAPVAEKVAGFLDIASIDTELAAVDTAVAALPAVADVATSDTAKVEAVLKAVEALEAAAKKEGVSTEDAEKAAKKAEEAKVAAKAVQDAINALPVEPTPDVAKVESVSAINETSVKVKVSSEIKEEDLTGKQVTLTTGETKVKATYVAGSLTSKGEATFKLDGEAKLVDTKTYTTAADWATIENGEFVAKVAAAYVAEFTKVTTGIAANDTTKNPAPTKVSVGAINQYGEEIAAPATIASVKVTVNGLTLNASDATYANGKVTITPNLNEGDEVVITLKHTDGAATPKTLAEATFEYKVVKAEAAVVTTVSITPAKTSLPAQEATGVTVKLLDQFNNEMTLSDVTRSVYNYGNVIFQVNGKQVTVDGVGSPLTEVDGKLTFKSNEPGEYVVEVFAKANTKVKASTTITVGAATLTGLTVDGTSSVVTDAAKRFNNEDIIVAKVSPNSGAALTPENLKFSVTSTTAGVTAADVQVWAETATEGTGEAAKEVVVIKAKSSKAGVFTITPYVGASLTAEGVVTANATAQLTTTINPTVTEISDFSFDATKLKVGATNLQAEVVFKNKHGEVLTAAQVADNNVEVYSASNSGVTGAVTVVQGTEANAAKTYVNLAALTAGTSKVTVQVGTIIKDTTVTVVASTLTTINAGADISGVVAGDSKTASLAKFQAVEFKDQDGVAISVDSPTITVRKAGENTDLDATAAAKLITAGTATKVDGKITAVAANATTVEAIKVHPTADVTGGTYTVTISKVVGTKTISDSFTITVGAERALTTVTADAPVTNLAVNGTAKVTIVPKDQYGNVVTVDTADITLTANDVLSIQSITEKTDTKTGAVTGYEVVVKGTDIGSVNAEFNVTTGTGEAAVTKKATKSFTVAAVGDIAASVEVKNPGLQHGFDDYSVYDDDDNWVEDVYSTVELDAIVKDANGNVVNIDSEDLKWSVKSVKFVKKDGTVVTANGEYSISDEEYEYVYQDNGSYFYTELVLEDNVLVIDDLEDYSYNLANILVEVEAQTANLKVGTTTVDFSTEAPKLAGDLQVLPYYDTVGASTTATVLDADATKAGIQISLDGEAKDGENTEAGTISVKLEGNDQYGNENVDFDELLASVSTSNSTIATIAKEEDEIIITPKKAGTTQVHIQYGGKTVTLDVTVTENNVLAKKAVAYAAVKAGTATLAQYEILGAVGFEQVGVDALNKYLASKSNENNAFVDSLITAANDRSYATAKGHASTTVLKGTTLPAATNGVLTVTTPFASFGKEGQNGATGNNVWVGSLVTAPAGAAKATYYRTGTKDVKTQTVAAVADTGVTGFIQFQDLSLTPEGTTNKYAIIWEKADGSVLKVELFEFKYAPTSDI